jgi:hypothetical protein
MLSTFPELLRNMNALRSREGKRPLTKSQIEMVREHVAMRERYGRVTCLPVEEVFGEEVTV